MTAAAKRNSSVVALEALLGQQGELFKQLLKESLQEVLEAEMTDVVGAAPGERTVQRSGYRVGYYTRSLVTRIGKLELRVPRDRDGRLSPPSCSSATSTRRRRWCRRWPRCTSRASRPAR
jgi:putative transposase